MKKSYGQFSIAEKIKNSRSKDSTEDFYEYLEVLKSEIKEDRTDDGRYDDIRFRALTGEPEAVSYYLTEINKYLSNKPFSGAIPEAYQDVSEAIFHEWIGFGVRQL